MPFLVGLARGCSSRIIWENLEISCGAAQEPRWPLPDCGPEPMQQPAVSKTGLSDPRLQLPKAISRHRHWARRTLRSLMWQTTIPLRLAIWCSPSATGGSSTPGTLQTKARPRPTRGVQTSGTGLIMGRTSFSSGATGSFTSQMSYIRACFSPIGLVHF